MSALPLLESNIVLTATTDDQSEASASTATSVLATPSIPMVLNTNSDESVSRPVLSALQRRYALSAEKIPQLTKNPTRAQVISITNTLLMTDCPFTFVDVVHPTLDEHYVTLFKLRYFMSKEKRNECNAWKTWSLERFVEEIKVAVPDSKVARPYSSESFYELVIKLNMYFDIENPSAEVPLFDSLSAITT
jgi:hypothetical protein